MINQVQLMAQALNGGRNLMTEVKNKGSIEFQAMIILSTNTKNDTIWWRCIRDCRRFREMKSTIY